MVENEKIDGQIEPHKKKNKTKSSPCIDYYYNDKQVLTGKHF